MKILQIGKFYPIRGGVEKVMYDLTTGLSSRGVECDMLCADHEGRGRTIEVGPKGRVLSCRTWLKLAATLLSPSMVSTAMRICRRYDIVHIHHPDPMACLALFCARYKGKVILHWHSDIVKQKTILQFYRPLQSWLIRRADLIIGTTPAYLAGSPWLQKVQHKCVSLPIGIPTVPEATAEAEALQAKYPGKKIIFSLGRLVPYKGFEYLVKAASQLSDDYVVLIGGEGPLRARLEEEIAARGLQQKVHLLGYIADSDLPGYFHGCTLFCLPSVFKTEAFGIVQIEAMSCGKPVVATTIEGSGTSWVNKHGFSGLNATPCNAEELADAISDITADADSYARYSRNARERYENEFTDKKMINTYIELLWKCMNTKKA